MNVALRGSLGCSREEYKFTLLYREYVGRPPRLQETHALADFQVRSIAVCKYRVLRMQAKSNTERRLMGIGNA